MLTKKQEAWIIVVVSGLLLLALAVFTGTIIYLFYPLLIGLILLLLGMCLKWIIEWCIKNVHLFGIKEKAKKVKNKLKIDEGINLIKDSINTIRNKDVEKPEKTD